MNVIVQSASVQHTFVLNPADAGIAGTAFAFDEFFQAVWQARVKPYTVSRQVWLDSAESLAKKIEAQWHFVPYRYSSTCHWVGAPHLKTSGTGGLTFNSKGRHYWLDCEVAKCELKEIAPAEAAGARVREVTDLRPLVPTTIASDEWGPIRLSRRKLKANLPEQVQLLIAFLRNVQDSEIRLRIEEPSLSTMALVLLAAEGDEGAEEELFNKGEAAKRELIAKIGELKNRKYRGTLAWLLLTLFPSQESREAVEAAANRAKDPKVRNGLLTLLAATPPK